MAFSTAEITENLAIAKAAYQAALKVNEYSISSGGASRTIKRNELDKLKGEYEYWQRELDRVNGTSRKIKFITPRY